MIKKLKEAIKSNLKYQNNYTLLDVAKDKKAVCITLKRIDNNRQYDTIELPLHKAQILLFSISKSNKKKRFNKRLKRC